MLGNVLDALQCVAEKGKKKRAEKKGEDLMLVGEVIRGNCA